jgi:hypothetical protein
MILEATTRSLSQNHRRRHILALTRRSVGRRSRRLALSGRGTERSADWRTKHKNWPSAIAVPPKEPAGCASW